MDLVELNHFLCHESYRTSIFCCINLLERETDLGTYTCVFEQVNRHDRVSTSPIDNEICGATRNQRGKLRELSRLRTLGRLRNVKRNGARLFVQVETFMPTTRILSIVLIIRYQRSLVLVQDTPDRPTVATASTLLRGHFRVV